MMLNNDIFEDIIDQLDNCQYISDLRAIVDFQQYDEITKVISNISVDDYSTKQWNELYHYLFGNHDTFTSGEEVKQAILNHFKK
ncbi:hypothetical protein [Candidatus Stoquefichus sp. SB1]|uniref:hypothetical protein n=1 Tax=Candidatus Stoquefichus sp. SB1 TaxID=1658109 RepID=UPI00067F3041|nr:hypothetical protein [Candidatus Stoquefichus sp. SB1]